MGKAWSELEAARLALADLVDLDREAGPVPPAVSDDSHLSPAKLAETFGVPADALRTRLNRRRAQNHTG